MDRSRPSLSSPRLPVWGSVQSDLPVGPDPTEPYLRPVPSALVESLELIDCQKGKVHIAVFPILELWPTVATRRNGFIGYTLELGLQCITIHPIVRIQEISQRASETKSWET
jgi:hypothetical protein